VYTENVRWCHHFLILCHCAYPCLVSVNIGWRVHTVVLHQNVHPTHCNSVHRIVQNLRMCRIPELHGFVYSGWGVRTPGLGVPGSQELAVLARVAKPSQNRLQNTSGLGARTQLWPLVWRVSDPPLQEGFRPPARGGGGILNNILFGPVEYELGTPVLL
jgi:hypothetical protein